MIELDPADGRHVDGSGRPLQTLSVIHASSRIREQDVDSDSEQDIDVDDVSDDDIRSPAAIRSDSRTSSGSPLDGTSHCNSASDPEERARGSRTGPPKLSFGISQILGADGDDAPQAKSHDKVVRYPETHPAIGFGMLGAGFGYGILAAHPGAPMGMLPFGQIPGFAQGVIKVPAHRPPFASGIPTLHAPGGIPSMMFPWMQERKDRLTVTRRIGHPYQNRTPPKRKKPRTSFSRLQIIELEKRFHRQKYLASAERSGSS
ncbi:hypothetical protein LSH36_406g00020 [Paralvinella palmiformis]|uniref:Homeobox domain-containing protein n=1 Tax=Paralvinella palmiformis TaxID=53620 RepID=A0AAD9MYQ7_9ANNE|nr:hypothetical protein LSH36_406g00020 [Paralvinella palmiformis]